MKKIEAIVRSENVESLREALDAKGYHGMTITEVKGRGKQQGITLEWRVGEYKVEFLPKTKLELVVDDKAVKEVIGIIEKICKSGNIGDGKIFVYPVEDIIRIRTGEQGQKAI
jgi:nitrogen regulatory protein P-II 1